MKFELDEQDLKAITSAQRYFAMDDRMPEIIYKRLTRLVKRINDQIPEPIPAGATRRIRIYNKT